MNPEIKEYAEDLAEYKRILIGYTGLTDTSFDIAYNLAQDAIALADRFTVIHYELRQAKNITKSQAAALKEMIHRRESRLKEIHIHCRMIWNRGRELEKGAG